MHNRKSLKAGSRSSAEPEISPDRAFLAACLDGTPECNSPFLAAGQETAQGCLWEGLICAAAAEFLLPVLHQRLGEIGVKPPAEISDFLAEVEVLNGERNARIMEEAHAVAGLLNGIGIEPVALKGAAFLLADVYPMPGCRYLCDLDLLVPHSQLAAAAEALQSDGYRSDTRDAMARFRHHHPQLQRPRAADGSGSAPLELHHSLGPGVSRKLLSGEDLLRESSVKEWSGVRIRVPSPEHLVTHLILHSQLRHCYSERIWPPLRALYDLAMLNRHFGSRLDWESVQRRFRACGREPTLLLHLLQAGKTLGMPLPFAFELGGMGRVRWRRRQVLNRWPVLRFADPVYIVSATLSRRMRFLESVVAAPGGWKYAARMLFRSGFYRRLLADIALR
jgi:hypothetical protein